MAEGSGVTHKPLSRKHGHKGKLSNKILRQQPSSGGSPEPSKGVFVKVTVPSLLGS